MNNIIRVKQGNITDLTTFDTMIKNYMHNHIGYEGPDGFRYFLQFVKGYYYAISLTGCYYSDEQNEVTEGMYFAFGIRNELVSWLLRIDENVNVTKGYTLAKDEKLVYDFDPDFFITFKNGLYRLWGKQESNYTIPTFVELYGVKYDEADLKSKLKEVKKI